MASPCGGYGGYASYAPAPIYQPASYASSYATPSNDCCCQCQNPCRFRSRARTHGSKIFSARTAEVEEDPTCNSEKLRTLIEENITRDPSISKRAIQKAVEEKLFGKFNVICAKGDFSYVAFVHGLLDL
uniref:Ground-like domain-containing protein n=1 Tax=Steinernema glaseri TaxID=37863 RepID=A0A1I7Z077_9BILA